MLKARLSLEPVIDGRRGDRRGQGAEILGRRAGDGGELLEAPVRQGRRSVLALESKSIVGNGLENEIVCWNTMLFGPKAARQRGLVKSANGFIPFVRWSGRPLLVSGERVNRRYTDSVHGLLLDVAVVATAVKARHRAMPRSGRNGHRKK